MITVHHLEHSRSQRILWLLEELNVPYEIVRYARNTKTLLAPPELIKIHPLGKSPVISDDGVVIAESANIIEYLVERYDEKGTFAPTPDAPTYRAYRYFMHYAEGSLMTPLLMALVASRIATSPAPFFVRPIMRKIASTLSAAMVDGNLARHTAFLEKELGDKPWFLGDDLSAADIIMSFPVEGLMSRGGAANKAPKLAALLTRIRQRPAYQRALERGGPYELLQ